ncbi:endochitinase A-like isoform X2 [Chelmon rostratus]|uniref:endochitinase A-like isoform X2 n=1 Tax=Chelmon rostratus TaxID=109905 RepID=UPI001BE9ABC4|nr:endochitinase A-like isoform X2 [Chelmon rostratus]
MSAFSFSFPSALLRLVPSMCSHALQVCSPVSLFHPLPQSSEHQLESRFFSDPKSTTATAATTTATTTTTTATTTTLVTRKQVVVTTKKPTVQSPPRKPDTKHTRTPIRPQPAPAGPITDSHSNSINSLLYYLLANSRQHAAGPLPGFNSFISQPIGGPPHRGYSTSESDELAATLLKRVGRREEKRWETGSSEDSSDES